MRTLPNLLSVALLASFAIFAAASGETEEAAEMELSSQATAMSVSATRLYADYMANEISADQRYKGKALLVTGVVDDIGKDFMDTMYVTLIGDGILGSVQCYFAAYHASELSGLRKGMNISIKGRCDGLMMNVMMKGCTIQR
jgi:hypothetical protein